MSIAHFASERAQFKDLLKELFHGFKTGDPLEKMRVNAWNHFEELGLPSRQSGPYRHIKLRNLFSRHVSGGESLEIGDQEIERCLLPECYHSVIVFLNGHYRPDLSKMTGLPKSIVVESLSSASRTYGALLNNQWAKAIKEETDPFVALNAALHPRGILIYLPPKVKITTPIQILELTHDSVAPIVTMPRVHLFAGAFSEARFCLTQSILSGESHLCNGVFECTLEDAAQINLVQVACNNPLSSWHFQAVRASLKKDSHLQTVLVTNGSETTRCDYRITLMGENAQVSMSGVWTLCDKREVHVNVLVDHRAPHCRSMQLFKGVLADFSRSSFEGKILVRQAAQKTEAFQLNNNLLLGERAHADTQPNLEIFADDVKASHGATVGQLDPDQLFYMRARGVDACVAQNLLIEGFYREIIDQIPYESLRKSLTVLARQIGRGKDVKI